MNNKVIDLELKRNLKIAEEGSKYSKELNFLCANVPGYKDKMLKEVEEYLSDEDNYEYIFGRYTK